MKLKIKQGFTLIELIIIIAIVALLTVVLVPRIELMMKKSKQDDIKQNLLLVERIVQNVINEYQPILQEIDDLEKRIENEISSLSENIVNPITDGTRIVNLNDGADKLDNTVVIAYDSVNDNEAGGSTIDTIWDDKNTIANLSGIIVYAAYINKIASPNRINVRLISYGANNQRIRTLEKVISQ